MSDFEFPFLTPAMVSVEQVRLAALNLVTAGRALRVPDAETRDVLEAAGLIPGRAL